MVNKYRRRKPAAYFEKYERLEMTDTKAEIERVEKALAETKSPYLKRDYEKYLRKLRKRLKSEVR